MAQIIRDTYRWVNMYFIVYVVTSLNISHMNICDNDLSGQCPIINDQCTRTYEWVIDWFENEHCSCNSTCRLYGDCCGGLAKIDDIIDQHTFNCVPYLVDGIYPVPTAVINKCPIDWEDTEIRMQCEQESGDSFFIKWPVSDERKLMYRNSYCAFCNGVNEVLYFNSNIRCGEEVNLQQADVQSFPVKVLQYWQERKCNVYFTPPDNTNAIHYCKIHVSSCSTAWGTDVRSECIRQQCEDSTFVRYVYDSDTMKTFKNMACAWCNGVTSATCEDDISVGMYPEAKRRSFSSEDRPLLYPLSIVFDLNIGTGTQLELIVGKGSSLGWNTTVTTTRTCEDMQVYDPYINQCRNISCSKGFNYVNMKCTSDTSHNFDRLLKDVLGDCSTRIILSSNEYIIYDNGTLHEVASGTEHNQDRYGVDRTRSTVTVCTDLKQNYTFNTTTTEHIEMFKFSAAQTYMSVIGQLLSIIALIIHLVVYMLLPQLRNLPGWNLMCLSGSLLLSQLLFLTGTGRTEVHVVCEILSVVMHYSFLAAFFWMNVMSFDLWNTFSKSTFISIRESSSNRFLRYSVYSWIGSAVIVLISFITYKSVNISSAYNPAYAKGICWITHKPALILFFGFPLALMLLSNLIFYILTICNIQHVSQKTSIVRGEDTYSRHLMVYTKLCVIMGLMWLFGFIATLAQVELLWYVFLIFNSLQGVFICITFVCTRKVYRLLCEKFFKPKRPSMYDEMATKKYVHIQNEVFHRPND